MVGSARVLRGDLFYGVFVFISSLSIFFVSLHFLFAGLLMPDDGDSRLNINTFMGLGDGPRGCGKVIENNKKQ
jgi:hypothetical protein